MKTYVLILSTKFPQSHPKAGLPTEFEDKIYNGDKIHTIRENYYLWKGRVNDVKNGKAILSIRVWTGKPYRSKQKEIARLTKDDGMGIQEIFITKSDWLGYEVSIDGMEQFGKYEREAVSFNDGLSIDDFASWFFPKNEDEFSGCIIHFTSFRYTKTKNK